jgi:hypothetical protein
VAEAAALREAGFDAILVENMHDLPYLAGDRVGHEITACMTRVALEIAALGPPVGVQILAAANTQALAAAHAAGAGFVRCENFVFAHVADEGFMPEAQSGRLLRERRRIGAERVRVIADIKKKHAAHAVTADVPLEAAAEAAQFFGADAVVVTGQTTGRPTDPAELRRVRAAVSIPLVVGSGVTHRTAADLLDLADALIVGSAIKEGGVWSNPVDPRRAADLVRAARGDA